MTLNQMLRSISSRELAEWQALYSLELLPQERTELLLAQLLAMTANVNRKEGAEPARPLDFLPWWPEAQEEEGKTPEQMLALVEALNAALGGKDLRTAFNEQGLDTAAAAYSTGGE